MALYINGLNLRLFHPDIYVEEKIHPTNPQVLGQNWGSQRLRECDT